MTFTKRKAAPSLTLPPPPPELAAAESALAAASAAFARAVADRDRLQRDTAKPDEILAAEGVVAAAREAQLHAGRQIEAARLAYQAAAREAVAPGVAHLAAEIAAACSALVAQLTAAENVRAAAHAAQINLGAPVLDGAAKLRGLAELIGTTLAKLERRQ